MQKIFYSITIRLNLNRIMSSYSIELGVITEISVCKIGGNIHDIIKSR